MYMLFHIYFITVESYCLHITALKETITNNLFISILFHRGGVKYYIQFANILTIIQFDIF